MDITAQWKGDFVKHKFKLKTIEVFENTSTRDIYSYTTPRVEEEDMLYFLARTKHFTKLDMWSRF